MKRSSILTLAIILILVLAVAGCTQQKPAGREGTAPAVGAVGTATVVIVPTVEAGAAGVAATPTPATEATTIAVQPTATPAGAFSELAGAATATPIPQAAVVTPAPAATPVPVPTAAPAAGAAGVGNKYIYVVRWEIPLLHRPTLWRHCRCYQASQRVNQRFHYRRARVSHPGRHRSAGTWRSAAFAGPPGNPHCAAGRESVPHCAAL